MHHARNATGSNGTKPAVVGVIFGSHLAKSPEIHEAMLSTERLLSQFREKWINNRLYDRLVRQKERVDDYAVQEECVEINRIPWHYGGNRAISKARKCPTLVSGDVRAM